jgi:hypothetical protein
MSVIFFNPVTNEKVTMWFLFGLFLPGVICPGYYEIQVLDSPRTLSLIASHHITFFSDDYPASQDFAMHYRTRAKALLLRSLRRC